MKQYYKITCFALLLIMIFTSACDDKFEEINTNPNSVTELDPEYLFANSVLSTLRGSNNSEINFPFGSQYAHIYTGRNNTTFIDRYFDYFESKEYKSLFERFYFGPIRNIEEVMRLTQPGGEFESEVRFAMAKLVAMINYARLADSFGSIPYEEGGIGQTGVLVPKYDSVEKIYTSMLSDLAGIIALMENSSSEQGFPGADPLFDNDLEKWGRFANSFRLRLAMRARFAAPDLAEPVIKDCMTHPLIEDNSQNAWNENEDSDIGEFSNPIFGKYGYWGWGMSEFFVEKLKTTQDPRLPIFVKPNAKNGEYTGIPNGLSDDELVKWENWDSVSKPGDILVGKAAPIYQMAAAEVWFLKAEAALFNIIEGDANEFYEKGIRNSFEQWGVAAEEVELFFSESDQAVLNGSDEEKLEQISTQLWISYMSNETEAWANIRRTGYPKLPVRTEPTHSMGVTNGVLPTRLKYPSSEVNINNANYLEAIAEQGPDEILTPLWWDVRN